MYSLCVVILIEWNELFALYMLVLMYSDYMHSSYFLYPGWCI